MGSFSLPLPLVFLYGVDVMVLIATGTPSWFSGLAPVAAPSSIGSKSVTPSAAEIAESSICCDMSNRLVKSGGGIGVNDGDDSKALVSSLRFRGENTSVTEGLAFECDVERGMTEDDDMLSLLFGLTR